MRFWKCKSIISELKQTAVDNNRSLLYYVHIYRSVKLIVDFF